MRTKQKHATRRYAYTSTTTVLGCLCWSNTRHESDNAGLEEPCDAVLKNVCAVPMFTTRQLECAILRWRTPTCHCIAAAASRHDETQANRPQAACMMPFNQSVMFVRVCRVPVMLQKQH